MSNKSDVALIAPAALDNECTVSVVFRGVRYTATGVLVDVRVDTEIEDIGVGGFVTGLVVRDRRFQLIMRRAIVATEDALMLTEGAD